MDLVLLNIVSRAVEEYNRYNSPGAEARINHVEGARFYIEFTGGSCTGCSLYEWVEDLVYIIGMYNLVAEVEYVEEGDEGSMLAVLKISPRRPGLAS